MRCSTHKKHCFAATATAQRTALLANIDLQSRNSGYHHPQENCALRTNSVRLCILGIYPKKAAIIKPLFEWPDLLRKISLAAPAKDLSQCMLKDCTSQVRRCHKELKEARNCSLIPSISKCPAQREGYASILSIVVPCFTAARPSKAPANSRVVQDGAGNSKDTGKPG